MASSFSYYYSHPKIRLVPLDVVCGVRDVASRPATTNHSPGRRRARQLVLGAYCCSGTLPDQFWVGKFQCAGSAKFAPNKSGREIRHSIGTRLFNHQPGAPFEPGFDCNWELVYQLGTFGKNYLN